jgi:hypothetical protein
LILPGGQAQAEIEDASRNGLGLICGLPACEGETAVVELADGRRLTAVVARRSGDHVGLKLSTALSSNDPLFAGGARSTPARS